MKQIGLMSDTHGFIDDKIFNVFNDCDEIWHAGDFGSMEVVQKLLLFKPLKGVYGNIDGPDIRQKFPESIFFNCEGVNVMMIHIGGYPGKYVAAVKKKLIENRPQVFISGHSHILKVMFDDKINCLHLNPGACGRQGWHTIRTVLKFNIDEEKIENMRVIELGAK